MTRCSTDVLIVERERQETERPGEGVEGGRGEVILKIVRVQMGCLCKVHYLASFTWLSTLYRGRHSVRCRVCKKDSNASRVVFFALLREEYYLFLAG